MKKLLSSPLHTEVLMPDLAPFQTDILCLLVGGNPLPDYVSAISLPGTTQAHIRFCYHLS